MHSPLSGNGLKCPGLRAVSTEGKASLIKCSRGRITVLDRAGLESRVCECYDKVKQEYIRLLPHPRNSP
jgi:hypothetical protein